MMSKIHRYSDLIGYMRLVHDFNCIHAVN